MNIDTLISEAVKFGAPGLILLLAVIWVRRYDSAAERTLAVVERDRDYWHQRAIDCETTITNQNRGSTPPRA